MELASRITPNCVEAMWEGKDVKDPIVQVLGIKKISTDSSSGGAQDRYRLMLSDGTHFMPAVLSSGLNQLVVDSTILKHGIAQLRRYVLNLRNNKKLVIVIDMEVIHQELPQRLNDPQCIDPSLFNRPSEDSTGSTKANTDDQHATTSYVATSFQQQQQPHQHQPQSSYDASSRQFPPSEMQHTGDDGTLRPIQSINPYLNKWTIRARVTNKSEIRFWHNTKGDGKLFSCDLIDESGEIRATFFNDAVDKNYNLIEINKVYLISQASVKPANKKFNTLNHNYELSLDIKSTVTPLHGDSANAVPSIRFDFIPINKLIECKKDDIIDIIGIVEHTDDVTSITAKTTQKSISKRDITLVDMSNRTVKLTLWNQLAESFDGQNHPVIAIKGVRVSDYQGISLGTLTSSGITVNPDIRQAHELRGWFDSIGVNATTTPIGGDGQRTGSSLAEGGMPHEERKTFGQIKEENLGQGDKPAYFTTRGTIVSVKSEPTFAYPACPTPNCSKKMTELGSGQWHCEKCSKDFDACEYRYVLTVQASDATGNSFLSCFNETGQQMIGRKADELMQWRLNNEMTAFQACFHEARFKSWNFKIRAKAESYQDELKTRCHIMSLTPVDYIKDGRQIVADIRQLIS